MIVGFIYGIFLGYFVERTNAWQACKDSNTKACVEIRRNGP